MVEIRYNAVDMNATKKLYGSSSGNYTNEISDVQPTGGIEKLTNYENVANYISFDGLGIDLYDDNSKFYEEGDFVGALSSNVSDGNGDYSGFDMTVAINTVDFIKNGKSVSIEFVGGSCSYCDARLYEVENEVVKPDTPEKPYIEHKSAIFSENNRNVANFIFEKIPTTEVCWVTFVPQKTKHPHSFIKIQRLLLGNVEVLSDVKDINITEEINILSEDLPMNELDCSLLSEEPPNFAEQNPLTVYSNGKFFGSFYVDEVVRATNNLYEIIAFNSIFLLEKASFGRNKKQWVSTVNEVITDGFANRSEEMLPSIIFEDAQLLQPENQLYGFIDEKENLRKALCSIAWAFNLLVDGSRKDCILLREYPSILTKTINEKQIIGNATFEKKKPIKYITFPTGVAKPIHETFVGNIRMAYGEVATVDFGENVPSEFLYFTYDDIYAEVTDSSLYNFTLKNNEDAGGKDVPIQYTVMKRVLKRAEGTIENQQIAKGETSKIKDFPLLAYKTNYSTGVKEWLDKSQIANKFINSRGTVKAKIRLRDEKIGDMVAIPTAWDREIKGMITYMNIDFGYEDVADIEITEWSI